MKNAPAVEKRIEVARPSAVFRAVSEQSTSVSAEMLDALNSRLLSWPPDFAPSRKLARIIERRRDALHNGAIDWGHAEALLFGSLLVEGIGVRISGQDAERGTVRTSQCGAA